MILNFSGTILFSLNRNRIYCSKSLVLFDFHSFFLHFVMKYERRGEEGWGEKMNLKIWMFTTKSQILFFLNTYASVLTFHSNPHNDKLNKQGKNVLLFIIFFHVQHGHCLINHKHMSWKVIFDETNLTFHQNI